MSNHPMTDTDSKTDLEPCPFCGHDAELYSVGNRTHWSGGCSSCNTRGPIEKDKDYAIRMWNARTPTAADKLEEALGESHIVIGLLANHLFEMSKTRGVLINVVNAVERAKKARKLNDTVLADYRAGKKG